MGKKSSKQTKKTTRKKTTQKKTTKVTQKKKNPVNPVQNKSSPKQNARKEGIEQIDVEEIDEFFEDGDEFDNFDKEPFDVDFMDMMQNLITTAPTEEIREKICGINPTDFSNPKDFFNAFQDCFSLAEDDFTDSEINYDDPIAKFQTLSPEEKKLWKRLLKLTDQVQKIAPWKVHLETEIFGIRDPITNTTSYCSIMGNRGEHYAIAFYQEESGYRKFLHLINDFSEEGPDSLYFLTNQEAMQIVFEKKADLEPMDLELHKSVDYKKPKGAKWPKFRDYTPGYLPWMIDIKQVELMIRLLEQVVIILPDFSDMRKKVEEKYDLDASYIDEFTPFLCRIPKTTDTNVSWENRWIVLSEDWTDTDFKPHWIVKPEALKKIKIQPKIPHKFIWELEIAYTEDYVQETTERPYFLLSAVAVDKKTKQICMGVMGSSNNFHLKIYKELAKTIRKLKYAPSGIRVRTIHTFELLQPFCDAYHINLQMKEFLSDYDNAVEFFREISPDY